MGGGGWAYHVADELFSLTLALHFCFVLNGTGRAHASVSHIGGLGGGGGGAMSYAGGGGLWALPVQGRPQGSIIS